MPRGLMQPHGLTCDCTVMFPSRLQVGGPLSRQLSSEAEDQYQLPAAAADAMRPRGYPQQQQQCVGPQQQRYSALQAHHRSAGSALPVDASAPLAGHRPLPPLALGGSFRSSALGHDSSRAVNEDEYNGIRLSGATATVGDGEVDAANTIITDPLSRSHACYVHG